MGGVFRAVLSKHMRVVPRVLAVLPALLSCPNVSAQAFEQSLSRIQEALGPGGNEAEKNLVVLNLHQDQFKVDQAKQRWNKMGYKLSYFYGLDLDKAHQVLENLNQPADYLIWAAHGKRQDGLSRTGLFQGTAAVNNLREELIWTPEGLCSNKRQDWNKCQLDVPLQKDALVVFTSCQFVPRPPDNQGGHTEAKQKIIEEIKQAFFTLKNSLGMNTGYIYANYTDGYRGESFWDGGWDLELAQPSDRLAAMLTLQGAETLIKAYVFAFSTSDWVIFEKQFTELSPQGFQDLKKPDLGKKNLFKAHGRF